MATAALALFLQVHIRSGVAQDVGNVGQLAASLVAGLAFLAAARRGGAEARGWTLLAVGAFLWSAGAVVWAFYGVDRNHVYPFPSLADVGFLAYGLPVVAGLLAFPREPSVHVSRVRALLDGLLIASAALFVSGATVLGPVLSAEGEPLTRLAGIAYPVVDVTIASLVLILALRRPAGARLPWVLLGGGLVTIAVSDSVFVAMTSDGMQMTGTPLQAGWVAAFLLMASATVVPAARPGRSEVRSPFTVAQELLPYVPVVVAIVIAAVRQDPVSLREPLLAGSALLLLTVLVVQQVLVAVEKVVLATGLEATVALRSQQLSAAHERFGSLVESSADAIVGKTVEGVVTSWNPAAERLYGYRADEIVGKSAIVLVPQPRWDEEAQILAAGAAGARHRYETERLRKDGELVAVVLTVSPILAGGEVQGVSVIGHDITERKRQEQDLAAARDQALEGSRAKSEFLATMSHEIRTPMNGVIGLCGLLLDTSLDDVQRRYVNGVRGSGEALLAIIDDILDFSKLEAGKVDLEQVPFDPRQVVEEVGLLLASTAAAKGLEVVAYCPPDMPAALLGDPGRLRQVLLNLAANAVKFTPSGEVVLSARVMPSPDQHGNRGQAVVRFTITDTGIGIDPATQARLFQPFSQADASTTRRFGGTGLGLVICQRLVQAMGGTIDLDSALGRGSAFSFTVTLPVGTAPEVPAVVQAGLLTGLRVLVVDDNETNRLVLSGQLTAWGMTTDLAADALSGLDLLRTAAAQGAPYAIAVLDLCMPDMDGLALATAITAEPGLAATRLMIMTSAGPLDGDHARAAGVRQWASKPVRSSELYGALMQLAAPTGPADAHARPVGLTLPVQRSSRGRVLVVEDNEVNQIVAQGVLHQLGYISELAADGREALVALAAGNYDVVLMDCHMPEMDGFQATAELRRREDQPSADLRPGSRRRTPVIAMTAGVLVEDRERCRTAGMDDFVGKPIDVRALEQALARHVGAATPPTPATGRTASIDGPASGGGEQGAAAGALDQARLAVLRRMDPAGAAGLVPAVINAFLQDAPTRLAAVLAAVASGDSHRLELAAHQLRGSAANLGATDVAAVCEELETLGRAASVPGADLTDRLGAELERARRALSAMLVTNA